MNGKTLSRRNFKVAFRVKTFIKLRKEANRIDRVTAPPLASCWAYEHIRVVIRIYRFKRFLFSITTVDVRFDK